MQMGTDEVIAQPEGRLNVERDSVTGRDFVNFGHVGGGEVGAYRFEVVFKATRGDEDEDSTVRCAGIAKGVYASSFCKGYLAARERRPLAFAEDFEVTLKGGEGLVLSCVGVRWRASAGSYVLDEGG